MLDLSDVTLTKYMSVNCRSDKNAFILGFKQLMIINFALNYCL